MQWSRLLATCTNITPDLKRSVFKAFILANILEGEERLIRETLNGAKWVVRLNAEAEGAQISSECRSPKK